MTAITAALQVKLNTSKMDILLYKCSSYLTMVYAWLKSATAVYTSAHFLFTCGVLSSWTLVGFITVGADPPHPSWLILLPVLT